MVFIQSIDDNKNDCYLIAIESDANFDYDFLELHNRVQQFIYYRNMMN